MIVEIILGVFLLIETYVVWNLFRKTELLETWVEDFTQVIQQVEQDDSNGLLEEEVQYVSSRYGLHEDDDRDEILFHIAESLYEKHLI